MKTCQQSNNKGFTLIELMITVAIAGVLLAIALFNTTQTTAQEQASNFTGEFKRQLKFARATAMTTGDPVIMCAVATVGATGACSADWETGTIVVFSDINNNGSFDADADAVISTMSSLTTNSQLISSTGNNSLRFDQRGQTSAGQSFIFCPTSDNKYNVSLEVDLAGSVRDKGKTTTTCGT